MNWLDYAELDCGYGRAEKVKSNESFINIFLINSKSVLLILSVINYLECGMS